MTDKGEQLQITLSETRRLHRRSLRLPTRRKWSQFGYLSNTPSTAQAGADAGISWSYSGGGGGLNLQIWDLNRAHETERTVFSNTTGFQHV